MIVNEIYSNKLSFEKVLKLSMKITQYKQFEEFEKVTPILPTPIYWLNIDTVLQGANEQFYKLLGIDESYIGTTGYDVYPYEIAKHIVEHDREVMKSGIASFQEEPTKDINTGKQRYFNAFKIPVRDENNKVIGLVGTLIEITDLKEKEKMQAEHQAQQIIEQERFKKLYSGKIVLK